MVCGPILHWTTYHLRDLGAEAVVLLLHVPAAWPKAAGVPEAWAHHFQPEGAPSSRPQPPPPARSPRNSEFWSATRAATHRPRTTPPGSSALALRTLRLCGWAHRRAPAGGPGPHSAVHGIEDLMSQHNCSKDGPTSQPHLRTLPLPGQPGAPDSPEICHYEKSRTTARRPQLHALPCLFGDPHLRTFTDRFQTCKVQGAWPLIDNNYLNAGHQHSVLPGSAATATSKVWGVWGRGVGGSGAVTAPGPRVREGPDFPPPDPDTCTQHFLIVSQ